MADKCLNRGSRGPTSVWIEQHRKGRYRIRWICPVTGERRSECCGRDRALARQRRDAKKAELREGLSGQLPNKTIEDLRDALDGYMAGKAKGTLHETKDSLKKLIDLCGNRRLDHVDRGFIMEFRGKRVAEGAALGTVNKNLRCIKSALSYAVDASWLRTNPLWRWRALFLREPDRQIRVVEHAEFEKLLTASKNPTFRVLLVVAYYQGLRRSELCHLRWSNVDFSVNVIRVVNVVEADELTKSRKNRTIPMHPKVRTELAAMFRDVPTVVEGGEQKAKSEYVFMWDDGKPFQKDWVSKEFKRMVAKAKIVHATLHDMRRSFSTLAQRAGVDKHVVKDLGGWSAVSVVERHYTGEADEALRRAMSKIASSQGVA